MPKETKTGTRAKLRLKYNSNNENTRPKKIIKNKEIWPGAIYSYKSKEYVYFNDGWKPLYWSDDYINPKSINTPDDIVKAFDALQERATELGYPIKLFAKERPIHPLSRVDAKLLLKYDKTYPNTVLAALNVSETVEKLLEENNA